ncbi:SDR family NAD(P)-dependent oxidoreductase (plasmid) [Haloferax prahovense]|jgi:NAD(P)-dependent dehydrogenase (short-subunit alcohol dehydrogenase family)|uniref:SDR family NAD(P)-dependent oxidoreductase n=1 Tax=Haloferax prahovense TaxID=381852 RepID=UPI003C70D7E9
MPKRFENQVAVVTGAGARTERGLGIGEATARRFAAEGANVVAVDVDAEMAQQTVDLIKEDGGNDSIAVQADLTDTEDVRKLAATVEDHFGRIDTLVNNAGIRIENGSLPEIDQDQIDLIIDVNFNGVVRCCKYLTPLMAETGGGSIINVSSSNAEVGRPRWAAYDATKSALLGLTRDMACDHAEQNIRVNAISPGATTTDFHLPDNDAEAEVQLKEWSEPYPDGPGILRRNAHPREQASAIAFLASEDASYITGTNLHVDGGIDAVGGTPDITVD